MSSIYPHKKWKLTTNYVVSLMMMMMMMMMMMIHGREGGPVKGRIMRDTIMMAINQHHLKYIT